MYINTILEIKTYNMASRAGLEFFSSIFKMFQTPQLYRISDDAGQHFCRVKKYIDEMKIDDQSEKIRILIGSLDQDAQFEIFSIPDYGTFKNQFDGIFERFMNLYKTN